MNNQVDTSTDSGGIGSTTLPDSTTSPVLNDARIASLRAAGYSDYQINAVLSMADPDDQGSSLSPAQFYAVNRETLNSLQYSSTLDETSKQLIYAQAPVALMQEISNPLNWNGDHYVGPGASEVNAYLEGQSVDFTRPSLDALIMGVLTARADILQSQLEEQIESINQKNKLLEEANVYLAEAKNIRINGGVMPADMQEFYNRIGAERAAGDNNYTKEEWDINIEHLKAKIESLTSQSQLETTKLQQTINKYNQTFEMLSNFINKYFQSLSTIISNLR